MTTKAERWAKVQADRPRDFMSATGIEAGVTPEGGLEISIRSQFGNINGQMMVSDALDFRNWITDNYEKPAQAANPELPPQAGENKK